MFGMNTPAEVTAYFAREDSTDGLLIAATEAERLAFDAADECRRALARLESALGYAKADLARGAIGGSSLVTRASEAATAQAGYEALRRAADRLSAKHRERCYREAMAEVAV